MTKIGAYKQHILTSKQKYFSFVFRYRKEPVSSAIPFCYTGMPFYYTGAVTRYKHATDASQKFLALVIPKS